MAGVSFHELKLSGINIHQRFSSGYEKFALKYNVKFGKEYGGHAFYFRETHSPVAGIHLCFSLVFSSLRKDFKSHE